MERESHRDFLRAKRAVAGDFESLALSIPTFPPLFQLIPLPPHAIVHPTMTSYPPPHPPDRDPLSGREPALGGGRYAPITGSEPTIGGRVTERLTELLAVLRAADDDATRSN